MAKHMKKKGFKRFFLGLLIYSVVFLGLAYLGLHVFWDFIEAYELSRPKNTVAPYVQQLTPEQMAAADTELIGQIDHYIQSEEACKQFIASTLTEEISYAQNVAESSDTKMVYMVLHGGKAIGKVTLVAEVADEYGFTPWKVVSASFDFAYLKGSSASITVPHDFTVYAGGVALDSSYITQDNIPYADLKSYYKNYQPPYMVTYTVDPILGDITLTTKDRNGNDVTVDENTDLNVYMDNCTDAEQKAVTDLMAPFLRSYVAFTSNAGGNTNSKNNYYNLLNYLVSGGDMAGRMYNALDGLYWARDTVSTITDTQFNHIVNLGDGHYLCDVTYTVHAEVYRDDPITVNNAIVMLVKTSNGLRVESLIVN